jgi:hypothetical protein
MRMGSVRLLPTLLLTVVIGLGASRAWATTYYVDPATGSDSNAGTSTSAPWKTPPGTRTTSNSGFLRSTWGAISTTNKIQCGDTILLKPSSTQTSTQGGAWLIDPNYYSTSCTPTTPITIQVALASQWAGSTDGPFTLHLGGVTGTSTTAWNATCGSLWTVPTGLFVAVNGVVLGGQNATNQLEIRNTTAMTDEGLYGFVFAKPNCSQHLNGLFAQWMTIHDVGTGIDAGEADNWQVSHVTVYNTAHQGVGTGVNVDHHVDQAAFVDLVVHDGGCGSTANPNCTFSGASNDLFRPVGAYSLWCVRCTVYNGGERGVNTGVILDTSMGGNYVYKFRDLVSYNNGNGPINPCNVNGHFCAGVGLGVSGNDWSAQTGQPGACTGVGTPQACCLGAYASTCGLNQNQYGTCPISPPAVTDALNFVYGYRTWGNRQTGGYNYGGSLLEIWNATTYNAWGSGLYAAATYQFDTTARGMLIASSIDVKAPNNAVFTTPQNSNGCEPQAQYTPGVYYDCFRPASADTEPLGGATGAGWPGTGTYASPPAWIGPTNKTTLATCNPRLVATSTTSWDANDWRLCTGSGTPAASCTGASTAIDAGITPLLADGAGSGNTITVKASVTGASGDPRNYLIAQTGSYLNPALSDTEVQIAGSCGVRHVVSMTATTITFDGASCSWADNAMVGRPWQGAAHDDHDDDDHHHNDDDDTRPDHDHDHHDHNDHDAAAAGSKRAGAESSAAGALAP